MKMTTNKLAFLLIVSVFTISQSFAATRVWIGGTSTDWFTSANWSGNSVPGSGDNAVLNGNASNYPTLTAAVVVQNFTLNGGSFSTNGNNFRAIQNLVVNGGTFDAGSSNIRANNIDINDGDFILHGDKLVLGNDLTIDGGTLSIENDDFEVDDDLTIISGLLDLNNYALIVDGTFTYEGGFLQETSGGFVLDNFVLNFSGSETFGTTILIDNNMTFTNGILITDDNGYLIFDPNATVSGADASSHVDGPVRKLVNTSTSSFTFPVGDGTVYAPIRISSINDEQNGDYFTAEYFFGNQSIGSNLGSGLDHISLAEYWILDRGTNNVNNTPTTDARVTLFYDENTRSGSVTNASDLRVARWNGSQWVNEGRGSGSSNNNTAGDVITTNRVTSFSPFTLGSSSTANPLPIELIEFTATLQESKQTNLSWATSSEKNNDFFTLEKSLDGINWFEIGRVKGIGTAETVTNYSFIDVNTVEGIQFYRLKQTDFDGKFSYSNKVFVNINAQPSKVDVFPVPAKNTLNLNLNFELNDIATIVIYNAMGQKVIETQSTTASATIDISELKSGIYVVKIAAEGQMIQTKFIKD